MDDQGDLVDLDDQELRDRVRAARREEQALSYDRRMLHGKIDVVRSEVRARIDGDRGTGAAESDEDLKALLTRLTDALVHVGPPPIDKELEELGADDEHDEAVDATATATAEEDDALPELGTLSDAELSALVRALTVRERDVSARRQALHRDLDRLRTANVARLQRRYGDSEGNGSADEDGSAGASD